MRIRVGNVAYKTRPNLGRRFYLFFFFNASGPPILLLFIGIFEGTVKTTICAEMITEMRGASLIFIRMNQNRCIRNLMRVQIVMEINSRAGFCFSDFFLYEESHVESLFASI